MIDRLIGVLCLVQHYFIVISLRQLTLFMSFLSFRVPCGSVVKCSTRSPRVLDSSCTGSSGFFRGSVLGQDTSEPSLVLVKPRKT